MRRSAFFAALLGLLTALPLAAQVPQIINYQGKVLAANVLFSGSGQFRFALVDGAGTTTYWSNDGTSTAGSQPTAAVSLPVVNGLYVVPLGDTAIANMAAISPAVFLNADVRLRVWFDDGTHGPERLAPDQRIVSVGYAMIAATVPDNAITTAKLADGAVTTAKIEDSAVTTAKIASGAVKAANIATGAVGSTQLADGAVGTAQIGTGVVQMGNIATGAIGGNQIASNVIGAGHIINGAIGTSQIATGAITDSLMANATLTAEKLVKPMRSGSIQSNALSLDFGGGSFTVPFSPAFATVPNVTASVEATGASSATGAQVTLTGRTPGQFTAEVNGSGLATAAVTVLDGLGGRGDSGKHVSMQMVNGNPAMCYYDLTNLDLVYIRATDAAGTAWGAPVTVASQGDVGASCTLEIVNGNPAIAYLADGTSLRYVRAADANGASWGESQALAIPEPSLLGCSLAVVSGNPAIAYIGTQFSALRQVRFIRATDASGAVWGASVAVDTYNTSNSRDFISLKSVAGFPMMAFISGNTLAVAKSASSTGAAWVGGGWVDSGHTVSGSPSLFEVNGLPAISYWVTTNTSVTQVRFIRAVNASSWSTPKVLAAADSETRTGLTIVAGLPSVAYTTATAGVAFVSATDGNGGSWSAPVVVDSRTGCSDAACLLVGGNAAVAYRLAPSGVLHYSRATTSDATAWGTPLGIAGGDAVGNFASMKVISGNPAVSYYDATKGDLKFIAATQAGGTAWTSAVTVDNGGSADVGSYTSLAEVNGRPAISYYDSTNSSLKYVRAATADGSAWGAPLTLDLPGDVGKFSKLAVVDGRPAIAYYDRTNQDLKYIRASDADGAAWGAAQVLDSNAEIDTSISFAVINGRPAVCYASIGDLALNYLRALDSVGSLWSAPVKLEMYGNREGGPSLATIGGRPAIAFLDDTEGDLRYITAVDLDGASWYPPVTLDTAGQAGYAASLAEIGGRPVVSYVDAMIKSLKWIRAVDANGTAWGAPSSWEYGLTGTESTSLLSLNGRTAIAYYDSSSRDLKLLRPGASTPFVIQWIALEP